MTSPALSAGVRDDEASTPETGAAVAALLERAEPLLDDVDLARLAAAAPSSAADLVAHVLHPVAVTGAVAGVVGWRADGPAGLAWAAVGWGVGSALPFGAVLALVRRGRLGDAQVVRRVERGLPVAVALGSLGAAVGLLALGGAPRPVVAVVVAEVIGLAGVGAATLGTKPSVHASVTAAAAGVLWLETGTPGLVVGAAATALVGWARVRRGRHTVRQVLLGAGIGFASALVVFGGLRD